MINGHHEHVPPTWRDLAEQLASEINAGKHKPGAKLPTQSEFLARGYNDRAVKNAMKHLSERGLVEGRVGSGYYVVGDPGPDWMQRLAAVEEQVAEIPELKRRIAELEDRG